LVLGGSVLAFSAGFVNAYTIKAAKAASSHVTGTIGRHTAS
jgi:uncharacterized membrane protein YoaK (UPF0700 family)